MMQIVADAGKMATCIIGILLIAGAIIYSLTIRNTSSIEGTSSTVSNNAVQATSTNNAQTEEIKGELDWIKNLNELYKTNAFIIVVLPGNDDLTQKTKKAVDSTMIKSHQGGIAIDTFTLNTNDPDFSLTTERLAI